MNTKEKYKVTIGMEVHAELKTKSKMFCGCKNEPHISEPNTNICPVCMAHPGTLPAVNKEAIKKLLVVGKAVEGKLASYSEFDRKNYFYPDIPKAYQLSQYQFPFVSGGFLENVELTRIHLEEDTARSLHDKGEGSIIDFNRAGVPLMELVTEPVIHSAEEAGKFTKELQLLLRTLDVSTANMEKGEMRVEANISISNTDELGTKVEVKNLNSFKVMESAIRYEVKRQTDLLNRGEEVIQETRGWDENKSKTFSQRIKESADDYRYFPDPDIPKMDIQIVPEFNDSRLAEITSKLPSDKRIYYASLEIPSDKIELIIANISLENFFSQLCTSSSFSKKLAKTCANYVTSDILNILSSDSSLKISDVNTDAFLGLMKLVFDKSITSRVAKDLLPEILFFDDVEVDIYDLAKKRRLLQVNSSDDLLPMIDEIIAQHNDVALTFKAGKESALKFLIGQGMKVTKGSANPSVLEKLLRERLS